MILVNIHPGGVLHGYEETDDRAWVQRVVACGMFRQLERTPIERRQAVYSDDHIATVDNQEYCTSFPP
jgi:hypothetical protein